MRASAPGQSGLIEARREGGRWFVNVVSLKARQGRIAGRLSGAKRRTNDQSEPSICWPIASTFFRSFWWLSGHDQFMRHGLALVESTDNFRKSLAARRQIVTRFDQPRSTCPCVCCLSSTRLVETAERDRALPQFR